MNCDADIIVLCRYFHPDVAACGVFLTEVSEDLVQAGFIVQCLTAQPSYAGHGQAAKDEVLRGVRVHRVNITRADKGWLAGRLLNDLSYCAQACWDVLKADRSATLLISTSPPYLGLIGLVMNLAFRQRFVYLVQDIYPDLAVKMGFLGTPLRRIAAACWQWLEKRVLCRASAIIVQGRDMGDVIRDKMPARLVHRIHIVPLCADHQRIHPLDGEGGDFRERWSSDDELIALYAGNIGVCHDLETILEAATLLQGEPVRIVFYGDGVKRKWLEATVKTRHLANVVIHDYVPCENLNKLLAACDVGLVAVDRRAEGLLLPWKTFNLMAAGKPVVAVASEKGDTGSLIADAKCGVLIEQGCPQELANCLSGMARDRGSLAAMGAAGRRYLVANLSRQHRARQFTEILRAVRVLKGSRIS